MPDFVPLTEEEEAAAVLTPGGRLLFQRLMNDRADLYARLAEAERERDGWRRGNASWHGEWYKADQENARLREKAEKADAYLADPAGNPLDAINLARAALAAEEEKCVDRNCSLPSGHAGDHFDKRDGKSWA